MTMRWITATFAERTRKRQRILSLWLFIWLDISALGQTNTPVVLEETTFETADGYRAIAGLSGQRGWITNGTLGNGVLASGISGHGQSAYVGIKPPPDTNNFFLAHRPLPPEARAAERERVRFKVVMQIEPAKSGLGGNFMWGFSNSRKDLLFAVVFDNLLSRQVQYFLDDEAAPWPATGVDFTNSVLMALEVDIDLAANRWRAYLDGNEIIKDQRVTTKGALLEFGNVYAIWAGTTLPGLGSFFGDDYMMFDDLRIEASPLPPRLEIAGLKKGTFSMVAIGDTGVTYSLESTNWLGGTAPWPALQKVVMSTNRTSVKVQIPNDEKRQFYRLALPK